MLRRAVLAVTLLVAAPWLSLRAQCADGSAPPCRTVAAATRTPDPPLDDRRWIVLPFTNVARAADLDWLSDASVKLLSIDMSRWQDVRVVDDERVADLLRGIPEPGRHQLGLEAGLAVAKRAGAGRLVMGDYLKVGARTTVTVKVYNARTGDRVQLIDEQIPVPDSIPPAYRALTPKVLGLRVPPGSKLSGIGTSSAGALRSYTLGVQAGIRYRRDSAAMHYLEAIRLDSTFALAYYRIANLPPALAARYPGGAAAARAAAARLAVGLPDRERLVINAAGLTPCELGARLLTLDSADAQGWVATGNCYNNNNRVIVDAATGQVRRAASLEAARRAYERALQLQPHAQALRGLQIMGWPPALQRHCSVAATPCPQTNTYWAAVVLEGDTLATHFEPVSRFDPPLRRKSYEAGRMAVLAAASKFFQPWTATYPDNILAHAVYGDFLERAGDLAGAAQQFQAAAEYAQVVGDPQRNVYLGYKAEVQWKLGNARSAALLVDSIDATYPGWTHYRTAFGRFSRGIGVERNEATRALATVFNRAYAGIVAPDFEGTMHAWAAQDAAWRQDILEVGTTVAFHSLRRRAAVDTMSEYPLFRFQAFLAVGDTARARHALTDYDAFGSERADDWWDAYELFAAESHLELGDTATAWARIEPLARRWSRFDLNVGALWSPAAGASIQTAAALAGRAWLLYADLAMATGHRAEARRGYQMIVDMWEKGEAPVQPIVKRAKDALAKLGGS